MPKISMGQQFSVPIKQYLNYVVAAVLALSAMAPVLLLQNASALQITDRSITMATSERAATDVTYTVEFSPATSITAEGVVIEFCANSPLVGQACTAPANGNTLEGFDINEAGLAVSGSYTIDANTDTNTLILNHAGATFTANTPVTITLGAGGGSDGVTNPTYDSIAPGTFYARILTFTTAADADAYTDTVPGSYTDQGGVAMSTASQLTVNARVQEELEFCVGAIAGSIDTDPEAPLNCADNAFDTVAAPTVDLGTVSSTGASISPVATASGGNDLNGAAMVRTNAFNGASVIYFAEQDTSSGRLKVAGATCNTTGGASALDAGSGNQDQCFNSNADQDVGGNDFSTAGEKFGMTASSVLRPTGSTTTNLTRDGEYNGDGTAAGGFAWDSTGASTAVASSTTVLDYEMLVLRFAARTTATTPTGSYTVQSTYVATATF